MGRTLTLPNARLTAAARTAAAVFLEQGDPAPRTAIDVGCDHAKLAVYLVQSGICDAVLATDIGAGPLAVAEQTLATRTVRGRPLAEHIRLKQNDGLCGLEDEKADAVFILGMGGELIADILSRADTFVKAHPQTVYVLQAMTSDNDLRKYLYAGGFAVMREVPVVDKGQPYSLIVCRYDGVSRACAPFDAWVGKHYAKQPTREALPYLKRKARILTKLAADLKKAGKPHTDEDAALAQLTTIAAKLEKGGATP